MAKKPNTNIKLTGKRFNELVSDLEDNISASLTVTFNDRRFLVEPKVHSHHLDESNPMICQLKGGTLQFLHENAFVSPWGTGEVWQDFFDLELEELEAFLLEGVVEVLRERGVIA